VVRAGGDATLIKPKPMPHLRVRLGGRQVVEDGGRVRHRLQPLAHRRERARDEVCRAVLPTRRRRCSGGHAWGWMMGPGACMIPAVLSQAPPGQALHWNHTVTRLEKGGALAHAHHA
jgi:hypothetical protein